MDITEDFRLLVGTPAKVENWREYPKMMFDELEKLKYIHYIIGINYPPDNEEIPDNWINLITVLATLKPDGLLFYNSWVQSKIQEDANKMSNRNIKATVGIAFSFIVSKYRRYY